MTLLGARRVYTDPGYFLVISDRMEMGFDQAGSTRMELIDKWSPAPGSPQTLMWGFCGDGDTGFALEVWLRDHGDYASWALLLDGLSLKQKEIRAGFPPHYPQTSVMLAGWVADAPGILLVNHIGMTNWAGSNPETTECFVGSSAFGADVAWEFLSQFVPTERTDERFIALARLVLAKDPLLRGFAAWEIYVDREPKQVIREPS